MSNEWTPTTEIVREAFSNDPEVEYHDPLGFAGYVAENRRMFDRWLSAHDAEIHREGYSDAICHIYPTADDDAEILDQFMDSYETPTRYQAKVGD